jgi:hypothetical protein
MEIRNFAEGELRWVESSGTGGWITANNAMTGQLGYVLAGLGYSIQNTYQTIYERGTAMHHKWLSINAPELTFTVLHGLTAQYPPYETSAYHFEMRMIQQENGSSIYKKFCNCVLTNRRFSEEDNGNKLQFTYRSLNILDDTQNASVIVHLWVTQLPLLFHI